jgi:hypothetical protein
MDFDRSTFFDEGFRALTGHNPLRWQQRLFAHFVMDRPGARRLPDAPDIPTGLGKTSVIPIWLLALAAQAREGMPSLPRRLVYVVNRAPSSIRPPTWRWISAKRCAKPTGQERPAKSTRL